MKYKNIFIIAIFLLTSNAFSQLPISMSDAINVAGRQRMLGQRMAKNKVYLAANKNKKNAEQELNRAIYTFRSGLQVLKAFAPTDIIKHRIEAEEYAFNTYKEQVLDDSKTSMEKVIETNTLFLKICDELVTELIKYAEFKASENENSNKYLMQKIPEATGIAGELRYLTQRLALYYALNDFEIQKVSPTEIDDIVKTLDRNLNYLTILEFNTIKIDEEINEIRIDWINLKKAIYSDEHVDLDAKKISAVKLYKMCNEILDKANITARMYTQLNKS